MNLTEDEFLIPAFKVMAEIKVKGSKFLATIMPALNEEDATSIYKNIKKQYYNATHNCYAYRINANTFRYSDDGEPSGTAGKPILQTIDGNSLFEIICVVTRYYGGTKLGTGGLIRAYSEAAKNALEQAELKKKIHYKHMQLIFSYDLENTVRKLVNDFGGIVQAGDYTDQIKMNVSIPFSKANSFREHLIDLSHANISIE